jgi:hypothetical protein
MIEGWKNVELGLPDQITLVERMKYNFETAN